MSATSAALPSRGRDEPLRYVSTRGAAPVLSFADVLLAGLARDGGLYVPEHWPTLDDGALAHFAEAPYADVAVEVMWPFVAGTIERDEFAAIVADTYATFDHPDVVPLVEVEAGLWLMELFHGPTLAFKDVALQLVGRLFDHHLSERGEHLTIVGATSGDTGSAAIEACRDRDALDIFILHPAGRVSEVQRRQMTTVASSNVHNLAVEGTFDDCQDIVKALFDDHEFRDTVNLGAVNSINWARVLAQVVYYVVGVARLTGGRTPVSYAVPTGNFGNVFAGFGAQRMGTPINRFVVGSNRNDILARFLATGSMVMEGVEPTLSPSMDIQVSSNFERLLFDLLGRDGTKVADTMAHFRGEGSFTLAPELFGPLAEQWSGSRIDDAATLAVIADVHDRTGMLLDPHTAVGVGAARAAGLDADVPLIALATAHPAKFPDAVESATGIRPPLPDRLADLFERPERLTQVAGDVAVVRDHITQILG
jgi:threonine synthase